MRRFRFKIRNRSNWITFIDFTVAYDRTNISSNEISNIIISSKTYKTTNTFSIRINNNSEYSINLIIGALIGFENGEIKDLITDGEKLIK